MPMNNTKLPNSGITNVIETDLGKLKILIKPVRGFKSIPTAYATIKGFEVMRARRKGQASTAERRAGIRGELRIAVTALSNGEYEQTESVGIVTHTYSAGHCKAH